MAGTNLIANSQRDPLLQNISSYYRFDEVSNSARIDDGPMNLTASDNNTVATVAGPSVAIPNACLFVRANAEYLNVPFIYAPDMIPSYNLAVSFWINFTTISANNNLLGVYDSNVIASRSWVGYYGANRFTWVVNFQNATNSFVIANGFGTATTGVWYHFFAWHEAFVGVGVRINGSAPEVTANTTGQMTIAPARDFLIGGVKRNTNTAEDPDRADAAMAQVITWFPTHEQLAYLKGPGCDRLYNGGQGIMLPSLRNRL